MNKTIEKTIIRVLSGEASGEDIMAVSRWIGSDPRNREYFNRMKSYWDARVYPVSAVGNAEETFAKIAAKIRPQGKKTSARKMSMNIIGIAACVAVAVMLGFYLGDIVSGDTYSYVTGSSISAIELPDGTSLSLNRNSKLTYDSRYGKTNRAVTIEGEAYFDVKRDKQRKFIVNAGDTKVTVIGTSFNIKNRPGDKEITTTLVEGAVRFSSPDQAITLSPGQQLAYSKTNGNFKVAEVYTDVFTDWKDNIIRVKSDSFNNLMRKLEDHFNVEIVVNGNITADEDRLTAAFDGNSSINQILDMLRDNICFCWKKLDDGTIMICK